MALRGLSAKLPELLRPFFNYIKKNVSCPIPSHNWGLSPLFLAKYNLVFFSILSYIPHLTINAPFRTVVHLHGYTWETSCRLHLKDIGTWL